MALIVSLVSKLKLSLVSTLLIKVILGFGVYIGISVLVKEPSFYEIKGILGQFRRKKT